MSPSALLDDDEKLEKIWKSQHSLSELTADKEFKSYDALKTRLDKVLGLNDEGDAPRARTTVEQAKAAPKKPVDTVPFDVSEDDDMEYFAKLADD
jgi:hypothetical protein